MRRLFVPLAATALALFCAGAAHAEKWLWYPVKGGAVAFDDDSRKTDIAAGTIGANTVIYYDKQRTAGPSSYNFAAERLEFECRGQRYRWSQSAVLDAQGAVVAAREDGEWTPLPPELGSAVLFKNMLCLAQFPPAGKQAADLDALYAAVRSAAPQPAPQAAPQTASKAAPLPADKAAAAPAPGAAPKIAAPAAKAAAPQAPVKTAEAAPKLVPLDLDALLESLSKTSEGVVKPAAKAPAAKAPAAKAPPAKAPAPTPKLRPLTTQ